MRADFFSNITYITQYFEVDKVNIVSRNVGII